MSTHSGEKIHFFFYLFHRSLHMCAAVVVVVAYILFYASHHRKTIFIKIESHRSDAVANIFPFNQINVYIPIYCQRERSKRRIKKKIYHFSVVVDVPFSVRWNINPNKKRKILCSIFEGLFVVPEIKSLLNLFLFPLSPPEYLLAFDWYNLYCMLASLWMYLCSGKKKSNSFWCRTIFV